MRRTIIALAALGVLVLPAPAGALTAGHLNVEANLTSITYEVEVCASRRNFPLHVKAFYGEQGNETTYTSDFFMRQHHRCATWRLEEETEMFVGEWDAAVAVYSGSHSAHTEDVAFTVAE